MSDVFISRSAVGTGSAVATYTVATADSGAVPPASGGDSARTPPQHCYKNAPPATPPEAASRGSTPGRAAARAPATA